MAQGRHRAGRKEEGEATGKTPISQKVWVRSQGAWVQVLRLPDSEGTFTTHFPRLDLRFLLWSRRRDQLITQEFPN